MRLQEFFPAGGGKGDILGVERLADQPWSEFLMVMTLCHSVQVS